MQISLCPVDSTLQDLMAGRLGELDEPAIVEHVQQCQACRQKLSQYETENSDSIIESLRTSDRSGAFQHEPDCHWATSLALGAIAGTNDEETHGEPFHLPMDLGDYRLLEPIAHGGMGVVYRAQHLRLGRDVAVKIISGKRLADKRAIQRFEAEMRTLGQLSHPNIVSALDARELSGQPVLVMEYVDGMDLSGILDRLGPLPPEAVAAIGRAVAAALEYSDRNGLVHRDVKPSNIMLNVAGEVKLLDLGLARLQVTSASEIDGTITGLALGTADYMSPEQIHDARNVDVRSDLYSLGCTLYKLLTGAAPYGNPSYATNFAKLSAHVSPTPILVPSEYKNRSPKLAELIERLTSKNRDERPSSAQEVALALADASTNANLVQLIQLARSAPPLSREANPIARPSHANPNANKVGSNGYRIPPWVTVSLGIAGVPLGALLGIWLTIKRPDGKTHRIEVPNEAAASIDTQGNIVVDLSSVKDAAKSKSESKLTEPSMAAGIGDDEGGMQASIPGFSNSTKAPTRNDRMSLPDISSMLPGHDGSEFDGDATENADIDTSMKSASNATSPLYRGYPFDAWIRLLGKDRNFETAMISAKALASLADSASEKEQTAKAILRLCRTWGGRVFDSGMNDTDPSPRWMKMVCDEYSKLMPEPGMKALIEELKTGNLESRQACETILRFHIPHPFFSPKRFALDNDVGKDIMKQLLNTLVEAKSKHPEYRDKDFHEGHPSIELMVHIATCSKQPFEELPEVVQENSRREWETLSIIPTTSIARRNSNTFSISNSSSWLLYWETLPPEDRNPLRILHQVFQDVAGEYPVLDVERLLSRYESLSSEESVQIKQFLVQRLADSDFDNLKNSKSIVWPKILRWLVRLEALSEKDSKSALKLIRDTEMSIIEIVGPEKYSQVVARRILPHGMGQGMGGVSDGLQTLLDDREKRNIVESLKTGCAELEKLFQLQDSEYSTKFRIPGGSFDGDTGGGSLGGGMF